MCFPLFFPEGNRESQERIFSLVFQEGKRFFFFFAFCTSVVHWSSIGLLSSLTGTWHKERLALALRVCFYLPAVAAAWFP